jgi:drug/metabolite transporter (DMT)-like permease
MIYLLLTVWLNVLLTVSFKIFDRYQIDTLQAIVANYWVCVATGSIFLGYFPLTASGWHQAWFPWALVMGGGFFTVFNLLGYITRREGITTATIANKVSLVIPFSFSLILYGEHLNWLKGAGMCLAIPAIVLTVMPQSRQQKTGHKHLWPTLVLFVGSGLLDTLVKYVEHCFLNTTALQAAYTIHVFAAAGSMGILVVAVLLMTGKATLSLRNLVAGILLGVPNYFSVYFFIRLLNSDFLQSSVAIPVNNMGIVSCSLLAAVVLFQERLTPYRMAGLLLSLLAIGLLAWG